MPVGVVQTLWTVKDQDRVKEQRILRRLEHEVVVKRIENHVVTKTTQQGSQEITKEQQVGLGQRVDLEMETQVNHTATNKTQEAVPRTLGTREKICKMKLQTQLSMRG